MWCGARNGRRTIRRSALIPATLWIRVTSIASSRVSGGRIDGIRRASIVLPVPGGPSINRLWRSGSRDLEREQRRGMTADVGQVGQRRGMSVHPTRRASAGQRRRIAARQHRARRAQIGDRDDHEPRDERRLPGALARDDQPGAALLARALGDRQRPRRVA